MQGGSTLPCATDVVEGLAIARGDEQAEGQLHLWRQVGRYMLVSDLSLARLMAHQTWRPPHQRPAAVTVWSAEALHRHPTSPCDQLLTYCMNRADL